MYFGLPYSLSELTQVFLASGLGHIAGSVVPVVVYPDCGILVPSVTWDGSRHVLATR